MGGKWIFIIFFPAVILTSCSIIPSLEKKRYSSGYHLVWKKRQKVEEQKREKPKVPVADTATNRPVLVKDSVLVQQAEVSKEKNFPPKVKDTVSIVPQEIKKEEPLKKSTYVPDGTVMEDYTKASFVLLISMIAGLAMSITYLLLLSPLVVIYAIKGMRRIKKHPYDFKGTWLAILSLIFGLLAVVALVLVVLVPLFQK